MEIRSHQAVRVDLSGLHLLFSSDSIHRQLSLFQSAKKNIQIISPKFGKCKWHLMCWREELGQSGSRVSQQRPPFSPRNIHFHLKVPKGSLWIPYLSLEMVLFSLFHLTLKSAQNSNQSMKKWPLVTSFSPTFGFRPKYWTRSWKLKSTTINQRGRVEACYIVIRSQIDFWRYQLVAASY